MRSKKTIPNRWEIQLSITEYRNQLLKAVRNRNYIHMSMLQQKISDLEKMQDEIYYIEKFDTQNKSMDRHLQNWAGKTLSLSLNEADLAIYHLDMFFAYFKERGYVEKPEWKRVRDRLEKALNEFREFSGYFFSGDNAKNNLEDSCTLSELIRKKVFTDREMVYYNKYEEQAGNNHS